MCDPRHLASQHHKSASVVHYLFGLDATTLRAVDFDYNTDPSYACHSAKYETSREEGGGKEARCIERSRCVIGNKRQVVDNSLLKVKDIGAARVKKTQT